MGEMGSPHMGKRGVEDFFSCSSSAPIPARTLSRSERSAASVTLALMLSATVRESVARFPPRRTVSADSNGSSSGSHENLEARYQSRRTRTRRSSIESGAHSPALSRLSASGSSSSAPALPPPPLPPPPQSRSCTSGSAGSSAERRVSWMAGSDASTATFAGGAALGAAWSSTRSAWRTVPCSACAHWTPVQ